MLNPNTLSWTAPTENTDGTPIDYPLAYEMNVDGVPFTSFPGTLNANGQYEIPFADTTLPSQGAGSYEITLVAFNQDVPDAKSVPSDPITVSFSKLPKAPTALEVS